MDTSKPRHIFAVTTTGEHLAHLYWDAYEAMVAAQGARIDSDPEYLEDSDLARGVIYRRYTAERTCSVTVVRLEVS